MATSETQLQKEVKLYAPIITLNQLLPVTVRRFFRRLLLILLIGLLIGELILRIVLKSEVASIFFGLFFITLTLTLSLYFFSFYYNSLYYRGLKSIVSETEVKQGGVTYEVAHICSTNHDDFTFAFLTSVYGKEILARCGIPTEDTKNFLKVKKGNLMIEKLTIPENSFLTLSHVGTYVYKKDPEFIDFLLNHGITEKIYTGAVEWLTRANHDAKHEARWWSRDNLGKVRGIGKSFSYGIAYQLQRYLKDIQTSAIFSTLTHNTAYAEEQITQIENILARTKGANVIVLGEPGVGKMDLIMRLQKRMNSGTSVASIEGKQLMVFDSESFVATHSTKQEFEQAFLNMFNQAHNAGNIIIVIENISKFFSSVEALGSDAADLMDTHLASPKLQFIATSSPSPYHQHLERMPLLLERFETVYVKDSDLESTVRVLEDVAHSYESTNKIFFSYPAILAIAENADRYIIEGVMPERAIGLLVEIVPYAKNKKVTNITKELVDVYTSEKTSIPIGPITEDERDLLLNLEHILHKQVIGQNSAIDAISGVMRRARADIQTVERPMGSFLFLGSTGVGKTETAKALAAVFFGSEESMVRLDMSEFSGPDALTRLIGEGETPGILTSFLKEHPHGVLLLDEFEKSSKEVHNLFLQILDEGIFSDSQGKHINARNTIIIATSNAGSDMIWKHIEKNENPAEHKDAIISHIIEGGIYAPELINRFDGTIIFEPLTIKQREEIAKLMLEKLKKRIKKQGYNLVVDDVLINILATQGYSPQFGARPMQRVMQDVIEEKLAEKIIAGNLKLGDKIWFYGEDFEDDVT